jgi:hypothetical protein
MSKKVFFIPLFASFLFFVVYLLLAQTGSFLSVEPGYSINDVSRWCERISGGYFREPSNALSNIGFITTGLTMFWILSREPKGKSRFHGASPTAIIFATAALFLGPGSLLMHGTHTAWGQWADWLSMIMFISIPWLVNIFVIKDYSENVFAKTYVSYITIYALMSWNFGNDLGIGLNLWFLSIALWVITETLQHFYSPLLRMLSGFIGFLVAAVFGVFPNEIFANFSEYWWTILFWIPAIFINKKSLMRKTRFRWFWFGMFTYLTAFVIWLQGYPNTDFCNPDSIVQAHALWHILSSIATLFFFFYFRSLRLT